MKATELLLPLSILILYGYYATGVDEIGPSFRWTPQLKWFVATKEKQARQLAREADAKVSPDVWGYFKTLPSSDWETISNRFEALKNRSGLYEGSKYEEDVGNLVWEPLRETYMALEQLGPGESDYLEEFGKRIIKSIPPGSIYFGGTDPGRSVVTALCKSHAEADPFFTLTQNAFASDLYLSYLRHMYGEKIYIPTEKDSEKAFRDYLADAQRRLDHDRRFPNEPKQIKPGEDVRVIDNRVQVSGQVAVMTINGLLAQVICEKNPDREFYIEESFPLDWMYPHLTPHGPILKIHRNALPELAEETVQRDHHYWVACLREKIGGWLTSETLVKEVCVFAENVHGRRDFTGFKGDPLFVRDRNACKAFSKLRSAIGSVYSWRATQAKPSSSAERSLLLEEAVFAYKQAYALCPYSPEALFRFVQLLTTLGEVEDALLLTKTSLGMEEDNAQIRSLIRQLEQITKQQEKAAGSQRSGK